MEMYGIKYKKPKVTLLKESGIGVAELAARVCYDSFENSENEAVKNFMEEKDTEALNEVEDSELLESLAWVYHHHSIIEHATLSFLIEGTSRGVLQEHARHRIQSISVRSTRYTMSGIMNAFAAIKSSDGSFFEFVELLENFDFLILEDLEYRKIEYFSIFEKLNYQYEKLGKKEFYKISVAKSSLDILNQDLSIKEKFEKLENGPKKRNVGDPFKHIVSDNWKVNLVVTFNIRSLKNYFDLRDSGAAWFQIQWLAKAMKEVTPVKYLKLIDKKYKKESTPK